MFTWIKFCEAANAALKDMQIEDSELTSMLKFQERPPENLDQYGAPRPMSVLVNQHPEPGNYERIMRTRRDGALGAKELELVEFCNKALDFFQENSPFAEDNPLFIISIRTSRYAYQFLYAPKFKKSCALVVGCNW